MGVPKSKLSSDLKDKDTCKLNTFILTMLTHNIALQRNHFEFLHVVGKGGFGKVILILKIYSIYLYVRYGKSYRKNIKNHLR